MLEEASLDAIASTTSPFGEPFAASGVASEARPAGTPASEGLNGAEMPDETPSSSRRGPRAARRRRDGAADRYDAVDEPAEPQWSTAPPGLAGDGQRSERRAARLEPAGPGARDHPTAILGRRAGTILWPATGVVLLVLGGLLIFYSMRRQRLDPRTQQAHDDATREVFKQEGEGPTGRPERF